MNRSSRAVSVVLLLLVLLPLLALLATRTSLLDYRQCERRCHDQFGATAVGERVSLDECSCRSSDGAELGKIARLYPYSIPPRMGTTVCGLNGRTYPDTASALKETKVLHGGSCGQCSEPSNIEVYRKTSQTLYGLTRDCAIVNMLLGRDAATTCFEKSGLTPSCSQCWLLNMDCSLIHCFGPCLAAKLRGTPSLVNGQLNECLRCDETHCGTPFIQCAGVNRRRAGIRSDIDRADDEIWRSN